MIPHKFQLNKEEHVSTMERFIQEILPNTIKDSLYAREIKTG